MGLDITEKLNYNWLLKKLKKELYLDMDEVSWLGQFKLFTPTGDFGDSVLYSGGSLEEAINSFSHSSAAKSTQPASVKKTPFPIRISNHFSYRTSEQPVITANGASGGKLPYTPVSYTHLTLPTTPYV